MELSPSVLTGKITIDGCDIQKIRLESLRRHVGLVSQDTVSNTNFLSLFLEMLGVPKAILFLYSFHYLCTSIRCSFQGPLLKI